MRKLILAVSLLCSAFGLAQAGEQSGQVTQILTRASDGLVLFYLSGTPTARPACASAQSYWMIKDENSATGKRQLAILLAARASGQTIRVSGSNQCTRWPDGEDVNSLSF